MKGSACCRHVRPLAQPQLLVHSVYVHKEPVNETFLLFFNLWGYFLFFHQLYWGEHIWLKSLITRPTNSHPTYCERECLWRPRGDSGMRRCVHLKTNTILSVGSSAEALTAGHTWALPVPVVPLHSPVQVKLLTPTRRNKSAETRKHILTFQAVSSSLWFRLLDWRANCWHRKLECSSK